MDLVTVALFPEHILCLKSSAAALTERCKTQSMKALRFADCLLNLILLCTEVREQHKIVIGGRLHMRGERGIHREQWI